jgi:hypothetical protein
LLNQRKWKELFIAFVMMVQKSHIPQVMHMRFRQIMTLGALEESVPLCTSLPEHGENKNVVIPETNKSHG